MRSKGVKLGIAALVAASLVVLVVVMTRLASVDSPWVPKCAIHHLTGLHCPGCGTTRALHAFAHGRFADAIRFNPLMVIGGPILLAAIGIQRQREKRTGRASPLLAWTVFFVLVGYMVARNVPSPQNGWLAPPAPTPSPSRDVADPPN